MNLRTFFTFAAFLLCVAALPAQSSSEQLALSSGIDQLDHAFYQDSEEGLYFIDFDAVSVIVKSILILDGQGNEKFKVEGSEAPINDIFEIDPKALGLSPGTYTLVVNSYTDSWKKTITVK